MRLLIAIFLLSPFAYSAKVSEVLVSAKSAFIKDDHFQSARMYELALTQLPKSPETEDIENYIISKNILLSKKEFKNFCRSEAENSPRKFEMSFYCAKSLVSMGDAIEALALLEKVPTSLHRLEYHLLKATALLMAGKSNFCIDELNKAQTKVTQNTSQHFRDLMNVTEARCYVDMQKFELALQKFQTIRVNSAFYITTLEEQAWVQFKLRNLVTSKELLNIIISTISSQNIMDHSNIYFRVRYLVGYIDLITNNTDRSKQIFDSIHEESKLYKNTHLRRAQVAVKLAREFSNSKSKINLETKSHLAFRRFIEIWSDSQALNEMDSALRFTIALNQELDRSSQLPADYRRALTQLKQKQTAYLAEIFKEHFNHAKRSLESIQFKSKMGQIENIWAQRTEGKRTIAEALDAYNLELNGVEEYLGK